MMTIVKTDPKLSPLKLKKRQHLTVLQKRKRPEEVGLLWNLLKSGTQKGKIVFSNEKNVHCGGKLQSTKRQSAGPTLRGRSWKHVNRLLPPEAIICHGLGWSVKNLEISYDFCEKGCQSQYKCVYRWHFGPCLAWYVRALQKWRFHLPLTRSLNPCLVVQRQFPAVLQQRIVAYFITQSQPNRLQCLVHVWNWGLLLTTHNCRVFESVFV